MLRYPAQSQRKSRIKTVEALQKRMKQLNTKFNLENTLCCAIDEWFETGHVPLYKYPEKLYDGVWSQGTIDWRQIFNGKISRYWLEHQGIT